MRGGVSWLVGGGVTWLVRGLRCGPGVFEVVVVVDELEVVVLVVVTKEGREEGVVAAAFAEGRSPLLSLL